MNPLTQFQANCTPAPINGKGTITGVITDPTDDMYPYTVIVTPAGGQAVITQTGNQPNVLVVDVPIGLFNFQLNDAVGRKFGGNQHIGTILPDKTVVFDTLVLKYPTPGQ
jgi:hypothetical protein